MQAQSDAIEANQHSRDSFRSDDSRRAGSAARKAAMASPTLSRNELANRRLVSDASIVQPKWRI